MNEAYFLGTGSKNGFFSCFSQLTPKIEGQYTYILKGGPGTGKSSLMRKIAEEMEKRDIYCERIFCSSDPDSLDGIIFPSLRVSVCDGTSPHTLDPEYPGVTGEIINLGDCWDKEKLLKKTDEIIALTDKNKACHGRGRRFIDSAFSIFADGERISLDCLDENRLMRYASRVSSRYFKKPMGRIGIEKIRLFDAITPKGYLFLSDTAEMLCDEKIVFEDDFGVASSKLIGEIRSYALANGFSVISSPCINREKAIRHIIIKELSLGFFTADKLCCLNITPTKTVSLKRFYSLSEIASHKARLSFVKKAANELMNEAVCSMKLAKEVHDDLEKCYIEAMNYGMLNKIADSLIERIWKSEWWSEE